MTQSVPTASSSGEPAPPLPHIHTHTPFRTRTFANLCNGFFFYSPVSFLQNIYPTLRLGLSTFFYSNGEKIIHR